MVRSLLKWVVCNAIKIQLDKMFIIKEQKLQPTKYLIPVIIGCINNVVRVIFADYLFAHVCKIYRTQ